MRAHRLMAVLIATNIGMVAQAHAADTLAIVTGPKTGTYIAIGRDIAQVAKQATDIRLDVRPSNGSVDNIRRLNSREKVQLGIVQSDVLGFMARSENRDTMRMAEHIRMIFPLYREEVHLLARQGINNFGDLEGKKVVIGEDGSGHMLTAINLFAMAGITPSALVRKSPPEGVLDLLEGKVDAVFFVGGKPIRLFQNLESLRKDNNPQFQSLLSGVHFLPLSTPRMLQEYAPAQITHQDYDFVKDPVPTIAVTAVLVDYDFSGRGKAKKTYCRDIGQLTRAIRNNLPFLKNKGHPKWKESNIDAALPIWKKDRCAWEAKEAKPARATRHSKARAKPQKKAELKMDNIFISRDTPKEFSMPVRMRDHSSSFVSREELDDR